jgi:hypothetical protein
LPSSTHWVLPVTQPGWVPSVPDYEGFRVFWSLNLWKTSLDSRDIFDTSFEAPLLIMCVCNHRTLDTPLNILCSSAISLHRLHLSWASVWEPASTVYIFSEDAPGCLVGTPTNGGASDAPTLAMPSTYHKRSCMRMEVFIALVTLMLILSGSFFAYMESRPAHQSLTV